MPMSINGQIREMDFKSTLSNKRRSEVLKASPEKESKKEESKQVERQQHYNMAYG